MRPLLASLALLLLGLCRPASAGAAAAWGDAIYTADSAFTLAAATRDTQLVKIIPDKTKYAALAPIMGNTLHALMLKGAGKFDALPEYYKKALVNGVLCEVVSDGFIAKKVAQAQYGGDALTPIQKTDEQTFAKTNHGIDCASTDVTKKDPCLCTAGAEQPLLLCLAKKIAGTNTKVTCRKEAVAELADKGKKALGPAIEALTKIKMLNFEAEPEDPQNPLKPLTDPDTLAGIYCDAIDDTEIAPLVAKVYAADALLWTLDSVEFAALPGGDADLEKACAKDEMKNDYRGKCLCDKKDRGMLPCMAKLVGNVFKTSGFLDCAAAPLKFDATKKSDVMTELYKLLHNGQAPPQPPGPTAAPPAGGNETTTAATGGAATSSLLLAPLAAAAAALLLL